jgi:limonene 1,2-monooxygenase
MSEALDVVMALLRGETVSVETEWFTLQEARLQLAPYSRPRPHVAVATSFTPSGPMAAGKHGLGLLSVAGSDDERFRQTWGWVEEAADEHGQKVSREDWKVVVTFHLAESREQAIKDLEYGYPRRAYAGDRGTPAGNGPAVGFGPTAASVEEAVNKGQIIAGDPDVMIAKIEDILERSGGVGGLLALAHEWAGQDATFKSYELFARYVMPKFQGQLDRLVANREWFEDEAATIFRLSGAASVKAFEDAGKELPPAMKAAMEARAAAAKAREEAASSDRT